MALPVPRNPKIYHIVHVDRLPGIIADGQLWCDAEAGRRTFPGTQIGMNSIKVRRLNELKLSSHPGLHVGECVPFYFCPRSVMLYVLHMGNYPELSYHGGQEPIIHLEMELERSVEWAKQNGLRWAFTLSNAGAYYFEDRSDLARLGEIDWAAVQSTQWQNCKEGKQAECLVEKRFSWGLVSRIGVMTAAVHGRVSSLLSGAGHKPRVEVRRDWYY
jgi:hypothetical protein